MSIEAVISRIGVIAQAQQQLASPTGASASAGSIGALLSGTQSGASTATGAASGTSFASALASAQGGAAATGVTGATAGSSLASTGTGIASTGTGIASTGTGIASAGTVDPGAVVAQASWNPEHKPIAGWIAPVLDWASQHGWTGTVTSGYRSYSQQASINSSGAFSAPAGKSNHETTQYPGGAVDVTDPAQLIQVLKGYTGPYKLVGGVLGPADPEHFSATGH
jgi:hypothetical protein